MDTLNQEGSRTSEKQVTDWNALVANILMVVGVLTAAASGISEIEGLPAWVGVAAGTVITVGGVISRTLSSIAYTASRTRVKERQADVELEKISLEKLKAGGHPVVPADAIKSASVEEGEDVD